VHNLKQYLRKIDMQYRVLSYGDVQVRSDDGQYHSVCAREMMVKEYAIMVSLKQVRTTLDAERILHLGWTEGYTNYDKKRMERFAAYVMCVKE
jgi:hypothetical protein